MKTTQKLEKATLERLRKYGDMGDSFDGVVTRLLNEVQDLEGESANSEISEPVADDRKDN